MTKLFPNSPGNYHNHSPTSEYDQETITIIDPTKIHKSYSQLVTQAYQGRHLLGLGLFILKKTKFFSGLKVPVPRVPPITTYSAYCAHTKHTPKIACYCYFIFVSVLQDREDLSTKHSIDLVITEYPRA